MIDGEWSISRKEMRFYYKFTGSLVAIGLIGVAVWAYVTWPT